MANWKACRSNGDLSGKSNNFKKFTCMIHLVKWQANFGHGIMFWALTNLKSKIRVQATENRNFKLSGRGIPLYYY